MGKHLEKFMEKHGIYDKGKKGEKALKAPAGVEEGHPVEVISKDKAVAGGARQTPGKKQNMEHMHGGEPVTWTHEEEMRTSSHGKDGYC